jgi:hypothetical protein
MEKLICRMTMAVMILLFGAVGGNAGSVAQCKKTIAHIVSVSQSGDSATAKMLVDAAVDERKTIGCRGDQRDEILDLQRNIYGTYIIERLRIAKDDALVHNDGHRALRSLSAAAKAAGKIDLELKGVDGLYAVAFFSAACQDLDRVKDADREGNSAERDRLRAEAVKFLNWALALDPRVEVIIKKTFGLQ